MLSQYKINKIIKIQGFMENLEIFKILHNYGSFSILKIQIFKLLMLYQAIVLMKKKEK
jgi:hypothetical protein